MPNEHNLKEQNKRVCWKCGMILDKSLTDGKLKEEAKQIEDTLMKSEVVDASTKRI